VPSCSSFLLPRPSVFLLRRNLILYIIFRHFPHATKPIHHPRPPRIIIPPALDPEPTVCTSRALGSLAKQEPLVVCGLGETEKGVILLVSCLTGHYHLLGTFFLLLATKRLLSSAHCFTTSVCWNQIISLSGQHPKGGLRTQRSGFGFSNFSFSGISAGFTAVDC
jgi:hypothetical protein